MHGIHIGLSEQWNIKQQEFQKLKNSLMEYGYEEDEKEKAREQFQDRFYQRTEEVDWMEYPVYFLLNTGLGKKDQYHDLTEDLKKCWETGEIDTEEACEIFLQVLDQCLAEMSPMIYEYYAALQELRRKVEGRHTTEAEVKVLFGGTTCAVFELSGEDIYQTNAYEIWVNDGYIRKDDKMVFSVNELHPGTIYRIVLKAENWTKQISIQTKQETVAVNVRDFGAKGDGLHDDTQALQTAVLMCPKGGRVYIPAGTYLFYQLFLKSDITIELAKDARLQAYSTKENRPVIPGTYVREDSDDFYDLASWEGNPLDCYASILTGMEVENVVICGQGIIDGGGDFKTWWVNEKKYPVMEQKKIYRPKMCFLNRCKNVVFQGVTFMNSPCWNMHPYFSEEIAFYGITLQSPSGSHNTDGIDPESCRNVKIIGVHFSVGDDCIAIKSGKLYMGQKRKTPSDNIMIHQCFMERGHGAVTIGSEIAGGVKNVFVTSCKFEDTDRGLRIKTRRGRGKDSVIDNITFRHVIMHKVKSAFTVNEFYYCDPDGKSDYVASKEALPVDERTPEIKRIVIEDVHCTDTCYAGIYMYGLPERPIESVEIRNTTIAFDPQAGAGIPAMMTGCEPVSKLGIFMENVQNRKLEGVDIIR